MFDTKSWWKSRTIWVSLVAALFGLLGAFGKLPDGLDQEQVVSTIMTIVALVTVLLRLGTSKPIG